MRTIDLTPLYRSMVGVDRLIDLIDAAQRADGVSGGYPPFNIEETGENAFRIEVAVAGFSADELAVEVKDQTLYVAGRKGDDAGERKYLHRGIAERAFERRFNLADHVRVRGARLEHGLLTVDLERELPEAVKPRRIPIATGQRSDRRPDLEVVEAADTRAA